MSILCRVVTKVRQQDTLPLQTRDSKADHAGYHRAQRSRLHDAGVLAWQTSFLHVSIQGRKLLYLVGAPSAAMEPRARVKKDTDQHLRQAHKGSSQGNHDQIWHSGDASWWPVLGHMLYWSNSHGCKGHYHGLDVQHSILQHTAHQQRWCNSSFQSRNVYFNSETSSLHWKSKLRNAWGQ